MNFPSVSQFSVARGTTGSNGGLTYNTQNVPTTSTVVSTSTDIGGNGGRKMTQLSNGWLVSCDKRMYFYVSKDNGNTWSQLTFINNAMSNIAICSYGTMVFVLGIYGSDTKNYFYSFDATTVPTTFNMAGQKNIETAQTGFSSCGSITVDSTGTYLHAVWASKNSTYPNCYNIRYAKGTINADGSVTWGTIVQITNSNASSSYWGGQNPSIIVNKNNNPVILYDQNTSGTYTINATYWDGATWQPNLSNGGTVYSGSSWPQSNPSAIYVPSSISGTTNGRIWVAWHGEDSTDSSFYNIRVSYSDDGGVTWSAMQKITSGNSYTQQLASICSDTNNNVYVVFQGIDGTVSSSTNNIRYLFTSNNGGSWSSVTTVTGNTTANANSPSTLANITDNSSPEFIYQDAQGGATIFRHSPLQVIPTPPEMYIPLYWWSPGNQAPNTISASAGNTFIRKGQSGGAAGPSSTASDVKLHTLNSSWGSSMKFSFECVLWGSGGTTYAELYDITSSSVVSSSSVSTTSTTATVLRSGQFTLTAGHVYGITLWTSSTSYTPYITDASLIVFPS